MFGGVSKEINIIREFICLACAWTVLIIAAMGYDMWSSWQQHLQAVRLQAGMAIGKDMLYRLWNSRSGGIYGQVGKNLAANSDLTLPNRDILTVTGTRFTMIDPATMNRQVQQIVSAESPFTSHFTSLRSDKPLRSPDAWERDVLQRFAKGEKEVSELVRENGSEYLRMMQPLYLTKECLWCHESQGDRLGELRGGLSVKIPTTDVRGLYARHISIGYLLYSAVWLLGLAGLGLGARQLHGQVLKQREMESTLEDFKTSLDNIDEAVLMLSSENLAVFYSNRGAWNMTGLSRDQLQGFIITDLLQEDEKMPFFEMLGAFYHGTKETMTFESVLSVPVRDEGVPVEIHFAYVVPREGGDRFVMAVRDISDRKRAEREKDQLYTHLLHAQKLESVGMLAAGIAHEINTPLQFLLTNTSFLKESFTALSPIFERVRQLPEGGAEIETLRQDIDRLRQDAVEADLDFLVEEIPPALDQSLEGLTRVAALVLAMKEFSRPGNRAKGLENINAIVKTTATVSGNEWRYVADLELDLDPALPPVWCLRDEIGQALLSLIINAAQAIENVVGSGTDMSRGKITIATMAADGEVVIRVSDTGTGIPEGIRDRIFDPFFTTRNVGGGTGQGLAISRDVIVNKHGGQLSFSSEYGKGTTFVIRLPLTDSGWERT